MNEIRPITCFDEVPCLNLVPDPAIIIGGTWLLGEFLRTITAETNGRLFIAVPFIEDGQARNGPAWAAMDHPHIDVVIITQRAADGRKTWSDLLDFQWRSILICCFDKLHAKVYAFVSKNLATCLVGSHNLTSNGLAINREAGVLFRSERCNSEVFINVVACCEYVSRLARSGKVLIDTRQWPTGEPENIGGRHE